MYFHHQLARINETRGGHEKTARITTSDTDNKCSVNNPNMKFLRGNLRSQNLTILELRTVTFARDSLAEDPTLTTWTIGDMLA